MSFKWGHIGQQADTRQYGCALNKIAVKANLCSGRLEEGLLVIPLRCSEDGNCDAVTSAVNASMSGYLRWP